MKSLVSFIIGLWDKTAQFSTKGGKLSALEAASNGIRVRFRTATGFTSAMLWSNTSSEHGNQSFQEICNILASSDGPMVFKVSIKNSKGEYAPDMSIKGIIPLKKYLKDIKEPMAEFSEDELVIPDVLSGFVAPARPKKDTVNSQSTTTGNIAGTIDLQALAALITKVQ